MKKYRLWSLKCSAAAKAEKRMKAASKILNIQENNFRFYTVQYFVRFFYASVWLIMTQNQVTCITQSVTLHVVWSFLSDILVFDYTHTLLFLIYSCSIVLNTPLCCSPSLFQVDVFCWTRDLHKLFIVQMESFPVKEDRECTN